MNTAAEGSALSSEALTQKLRQVYARKRDRSTEQERWSRRLVAVHGRCEAQTLDLEGVPVRVVPVASELQLRASLPDFGDPARVAYVLSYPAVELPVDIAGRFLRSGRVVHIAKHERLREVFAGSSARGRSSLIELEPSLISSRLGQFLINSGRTLGGASGRVTLARAYARWLHEEWQVPQRLSLDNLLAFVATSQRHESFLDATDPSRAPASKGLREELLELLERQLGPEGALAWRCWLAGKGPTLLAYALVLEACAGNDPEALAGALQLIAQTQLGLDDATYLRITERQALALAAESALELHTNAQPEAARSSARRSVLLAAQELVPSVSRKHLAGSHRLPIAWELRLDKLGEVMSAFVAKAKVGAEDYRALSEGLRELELHELRDPELFAHAEYACRLAAWLVVRPDQHWLRRPGPIGQLEALAGWYAQEGGYVDLARRRLRRSLGTPAYQRGVGSLLARVDEVREELDKKCAEGITSWLGANRDDKRVLPIDRVVDELGVAFLRAEGGATRKLAVVVLDGMAWAQAIEFLEELGRDDATTPWHPLGFNRDAVELHPSATLVPVLAALPTMTHVSRSALFGGEPAPSGVEPNSRDDGRRWAKHPGASGLFKGSRTPTLLTAREAFTAKGISAAAETAITDEQQPVVAFLINTIDASLKADRHDEAPWTIGRIGPFAALLQALHGAGRAVLLCSDHGHVPGQRLRYAGTKAASARWRPWRDGDTVQAFETAIPAPPGWRPQDPNARGVVVIHDERHAYSAKPNQGEHGGCTLAELVAPAILLGTKELFTNELADSPATATQPHLPPSWWVDEVREGEGRRRALDNQRRDRLAKLEAEERERAKAEDFELQAPTAQLSLAVVAPPERPGPDEAKAKAERQALAVAEAEARVAAVEAKAREKGKKSALLTEDTVKLLDKLERNPLFEARVPLGNKREEVLAALEYLLERRDQAPGAAFARRLGMSERRVAQAVSDLSMILNIDGYDVLHYERSSKQVVLQRELLTQGFGL